MAQNAPKRGLPPSHPGEIIKEVILPGLKAERGMSAEAVAEALKVNRRMLYKLMSRESAMTPEMALRWARLCGNSAEFWLNLQQAWDLWSLRQDPAVAAELSAIPQLVEAAPAPSAAP